jgi:LPXTG-motif cell wall-anchored protein
MVLSKGPDGGITGEKEGWFSRGDKQAFVTTIIVVNVIIILLLVLFFIRRKKNNE